MALPGVLLIDHDREYRAQLAQYIALNGFVSKEFDDFDAALEYLQSSDDAFVVVPELTVQSRHLLDFISHIKGVADYPILVLSAQAEGTEKIVALELGADDFIPKTTERREILARIRAAVRRMMARPVVTPHLPQGGAPNRADPAAPRPWQFRRDKRELLDPSGRPVRLTSAEFSLLDAFVGNTGLPLRRDDLSMAALGRPYRVSDRSIDNLVAKLRRKLREPAKGARMIKTARPVGYVFTGFTEVDGSDEPIPSTGQT